MKVANEKNLRPGEYKLTQEEAKKGGKKSAEVRREKKMLRELLEEALEKKTKTGNHYIDITSALIKEAEKGNVKAYETISAMLGQKPTEKIDITENVPIVISGGDKLED